MNEARRARANARRRDWIASAHRLEESPAAQAGSASERVVSVWQITLDTWALSGRSLPDYKRSEMPIQRRQLCEGRPSGHKKIKSPTRSTSNSAHLQPSPFFAPTERTARSPTQFTRRPAESSALVADFVSSALCLFPQ